LNASSEASTCLDPPIAYYVASEGILQNVYEPLLWYNGTSSTQAIPWLAKSYTLSANGTVASFVLRSNITFADGDPLNSSAVFFSFNRILFDDQASPTWMLAQLENRSLSSYFSGPQNYTQAWAERVLGENFVEITGPLTFDLHVQNPTAALPYLLAETWAAIVDPTYVMNKDIALWTAPNSTYVLPYQTLTGSFMNRMVEYLKDQASTCYTGVCAISYLGASTHGSLAGTGPYTIKSVSIGRSVVLQARQDYWGGPYQFLGGSRMVPHIQTIYVDNVPLQSQRTRDLTLAGSSGRTMMIDINTTFDASRLFDVANESDWISHGNVMSVLPNVTVVGPATRFQTNFDAFETNVTGPPIGGVTSYNQFQPFSDIRFRLAFADSVDIAAANKDFNNNLGHVAINAIPPGLPPDGSYNSSNLPEYRYDPTAVQKLLLSAMSDPITRFHFMNGTTAPSGLFNNTFGCAYLDARNICSDPVGRTIALAGVTPADIGILDDIAATINNISLTYNMGLQVVVHADSYTQLFQNWRQIDMYALGWVADYPYVGDFDMGMFNPQGTYLQIGQWNVSAISHLWSQLTEADSRGDTAGVVSSNDKLNALANQMVLYLWTYYTYGFFAYTSNIQGFYYNPSLWYPPFVALSVVSSQSIAHPPSGSLLTLAPLALVGSLAVLIVVGASLYVIRRRDRAKKTASDPGGGQSSPPQTAATVTAGAAAELMAEPQQADDVLGFEKPGSRLAFDYLVTSFIDDYMRKRLYSEQSGWRSLVQISQECKISQGALYGRGGNHGPVIAELQSRGLIEVRTFTGQRGRGGDVIKVRVAYDKEPLKQYVDKRAMKK
jgi:ABC-type transport system substrate-binding protein